MPQYVECKFRPSDRRAYTYRNDGDPVAAGDYVKVPDKSGEGWKRVQVVTIEVPEPNYSCKPVLGLADEPEQPTGLL